MIATPGFVAVLGSIPALGLATARSFGNLADVPVDPDGDQARDWIIQELAKPEYQAAQPTWFDRLSEAFWNWLKSLDLSGGGAAQSPLLAILILVIAAALVAAFLIYGVPRLRRRSTLSGSLFGANESRGADDLRAAAALAADRKDWPLAIEELFRSIAKRLAEREIVATSPGTTAREFAQRAAAILPAFTERLVDSGALFDRVRYLDEPATKSDYEQLAELEGELRSVRPATASAATDVELPQ